MAEITGGKPYTDKLGNEYICRSFDVSSDDYVWHRDANDRTIEIVEGNGWTFQIEGCLPFLLKRGLVFTIEKNVYHRLIKGVDDLEIKITEHK